MSTATQSHTRTTSCTTAITEGLKHLLANTYTLYLKTQNFHWNVTGPHFHSLHGMFEEQYTELQAAVDEIAERIRALGCFAPGSFREFNTLATLHDASGTPRDMEMVKQLLKDHEVVIEQLIALMPTVQSLQDEATQDLLIRRTETHQKTAWMLRSTCGE